jgi:hypothetical protein
MIYLLILNRIPFVLSGARWTPGGELEPDAGARSVADADRRPGRTGDDARGPAGAARRGTSETQFAETSRP